MSLSTDPNTILYGDGGQTKLSGSIQISSQRPVSSKSWWPQDFDLIQQLIDDQPNADKSYWIDSAGFSGTWQWGVRARQLSIDFSRLDGWTESRSAFWANNVLPRSETDARSADKASFVHRQDGTGRADTVVSKTALGCKPPIVSTELLAFIEKESGLEGEWRYRQPASEGRAGMLYYVNTASFEQELLGYLMVL